MKKGDYITDGKYIRKVLAVVDGDLIGYSHNWEIEDTEDIKKNSENSFYGFALKTNLERSWKVMEKEWRPEDLKDGDKYYFIDCFGYIFSAVCTNQKADLYRLKTKNIYKDQESAEEALKKIME